MKKKILVQKFLNHSAVLYSLSYHQSLKKKLKKRTPSRTDPLYRVYQIKIKTPNYIRDSPTA